MTIFSALSSLFLPSNSEPIRLKWIKEATLQTIPEAEIASISTKPNTLDSAPTVQAINVGKRKFASEVEPFLCLKTKQKCFNVDMFAAEFSSENRSEYQKKCIGLDIGLVIGSLNSTLEDDFHATICGIEYNEQFQITDLTVYKQRSEDISKESIKYKVDVNQIISITVL